MTKGRDASQEYQLKGYSVRRKKNSYLVGNIICQNITGVYIELYDKDTPNGIDVKLYLTTVRYLLSILVFIHIELFNFRKFRHLETN